MHPPEDTGILIVTTTVGSMAQAQALAGRIIEARLAACVQIDPLAQSVYRWEGKVCGEPEVRLTLKTLPRAEAALQRLFTDHHPYDLPQFVCVAGSASPAYAAWVRGEVEVAAG
jgi:periplasmic divalent cation tolerance protein